MATNQEISSSRARVNITLELETGDAAVRKELPLKLLVLGAFDPTQTKQSISQTERLPVTAQTFDLVLNTVAPSLTLNLPNGSVELTFNELKDFSPQAIAEKVPRLQRLLAMRNCLKDLKSLLTDSPQLQHNLKQVLQE